MRSPTDYWNQVQDLVANNGWAVIGVMADPEKSAPSYSYTVGLSARGMSDLVVIGLDPKTAQTILNTAVDRVMATKAEMAPGAMLTEVATVPLRLKPLQPSQFRPVALSAVSYAANAGVEPAVVQLEFPDPNGYFPGETACDPKFARLQDVDVLCAAQVASESLEQDAPRSGRRSKPH